MDSHNCRWGWPQKCCMEEGKEMKDFACELQYSFVSSATGVVRSFESVASARKVGCKVCVWVESSRSGRGSSHWGWGNQWVCSGGWQEQESYDYKVREPLGREAWKDYGVVCSVGLQPLGLSKFQFHMDGGWS